MKIKARYAAVVLTAVMLAAVFFVLRPDGEAQTFNPTEQLKIPIIMYHSLLNDPSLSGDYVLTPTALEQDIEYLKSRGYTAVFMRDIIGYVQSGTPLPEKPIILTFDDGFLNNMLYLPEILEKHDVRAVVSVVGEYADMFTAQPDKNPAYAYMSWAEVGELAENPRIEIQNHSYNFHHQKPRKGAMRKKGESDEKYAEMLKNDALAVNNKLLELGITPNTYTYPYGQISRGADELLKNMGFAATLSCYEKVSRLKQGDPESLYSLGRYNRAAKYSTEDFMRKVLGE